MDLLDFIPQNVFESLGILIGLLGCLTILFQLVKEWRDPAPSSMGVTCVVGWLIIFIFWLLYGVRFRAVAIYLSNFVALILQLGLLKVVLSKRRT